MQSMQSHRAVDAQERSLTDSKPELRVHPGDRVSDIMTRTHDHDRRHGPRPRRTINRYSAYRFHERKSPAALRF